MNRTNTEVTSQPFGISSDGHPVMRYLIKNHQMEVSVLSYGATISQLKVPDRNGALRDVVLGYDTLKEYEAHTCYFGAVIGRCANRIGGGRFRLNQQEYRLAQNNGNHCLHGGITGFDRRVWVGEILPDGVRLSLTSLHNEEGFPGELRVTVDYRLKEDCCLCIHYQALSDRDTICNLTNHSYFNLNGHGLGTASEHVLQIESDYYTPLNSDFVPDGQVLKVDGSPFDFRKPRLLGAGLSSHHPQIQLAGGYDHNFALRSFPSRDGQSPFLAACACSAESGIHMETFTTMPGVQLYTPNYKEEMAGKDGRVYQGRCAFCLETQYFPNALAYGHWKKPILLSGEPYLHTTTYRFSIL